MGIGRHVSKNISKVVSPSQWMGYESLRQNGLLIGKILLRTLGRDKKEKLQGLSFEQCKAHFNLTEADIQLKMKNMLQIVQYCLILSVACFAYAIYLLVTAKILAAFVTITLMGVMLSYAFREHFNYFQMKQRRLGCTFKQWFNYVLKGHKK